MFNWESLKSALLAFASLVLPLVIALVGHWYTQAIKERDVQAKFVELAVQILKEKPDPKDTSLREWAVDVLDKYSGVPLGSAKNGLINSYPFPTTTRNEIVKGVVSEVAAREYIEKYRSQGAVAVSVTGNPDGTFTVESTWPVK